MLNYQRVLIIVLIHDLTIMNSEHGFVWKSNTSGMPPNYGNFIVENYDKQWVLGVP